MDGIEPIVRWGAARLGGSCHAWGDARPDRALGCVDCDARFARARYSYQSHTMRALRAVAYPTNALQVRTLVAGERFRGCASLPLETDVTERLPVGVADGEQGVRFIDGPRRDRNGRGSRNRRARDKGNRRTSAPSDCNGLTVPDGPGDQRLGDVRDYRTCAARISSRFCRYSLRPISPRA